jgi:hypothetical protein
MPTTRGQPPEQRMRSTRCFIHMEGLRIVKRSEAFDFLGINHHRASGKAPARE